MTHIMNKIFLQSFTVPRHSFVWFVLEFSERFWTSFTPTLTYTPYLQSTLYSLPLLGPATIFLSLHRCCMGLELWLGRSPQTQIIFQIADHHLPVFYWFHLIGLIFLGAWALPDMVLEVLHTRLNFDLVRLQNIKGKLSALFVVNQKYWAEKKTLDTYTNLGDLLTKAEWK